MSNTSLPPFFPLKQEEQTDQEQSLRDKLVSSLKQRQEAVIGHHQRQVTRAQMGQVSRRGVEGGAGAGSVYIFN